MLLLRKKVIQVELVFLIKKNRLKIIIIRIEEYLEGYLNQIKED
jgi:hypothetical protein